MKVIMLDETKSRRQELSNLLEQKGHSVNVCINTNNFIDAVETGSPDTIFLDVEAWFRGRSIFNYIGFAKKLSKYPVIFYNAPENFSGLPERSATPKDKIYKKKTDIDIIAEAV